MATRLSRLLLPTQLYTSYVKHLCHHRFAVRWPTARRGNDVILNQLEIHNSIVARHISTLNTENSSKEFRKILSEDAITKSNDVKRRAESSSDSNTALYGESDNLKIFAHKLYEIDSEDHLVHFVENQDTAKSLGLTEITLILCRLAALRSSSVRSSSVSYENHDLKINPRFGLLVERLNADIGSNANNMDIALSALSALLQLKVDTTTVDKIVKFVKDSMMTRMSMGQLVRLLGSVLPSTSTKITTNYISSVKVESDQLVELIESLRREALSAVEHRWVEILSPKDIITLMHLIPNDSELLISRLSERALEHMDKMTIKQLYRMLYCLARRQMRNMPLIRSITYHINKIATSTIVPAAVNFESVLTTAKEDESVTDNFNFTADKQNANDELFDNMHEIDDANDRNTEIQTEVIDTKKVYSLYPLTLVQISNLAYACATLNIYNTQLLTNIGQSSIIVSCQKNSQDSIALLSSIIHSFAELRWYDKEVLDLVCIMYFEVSSHKNSVNKFNNTNLTRKYQRVAKLSEAFKEKVEISKLQSEHLINLIISLGCLNYSTTSISSSLPAINKHLLKKYLALRNKSDAIPFNPISDRIWLDFVWSTAVLDKLTSNLASTVLERSFVNRIKDSTYGAPALTKLLHVDSLVRSTLPQYSGEALDTQVVNLAASSINARKTSPLKKSLLEALAAVLTIEKYVKLDVASPCGYIIDAELFTNDLGQPQPITEQLESVEGQGLPAGYHRIAIKLLEFSDVTLGAVEQPIGYHALGMRLLGAAGYLVVPIFHLEFQKDATVAKRAQVVQTKIREALRDANKQSTLLSAKNVQKANITNKLTADREQNLDSHKLDSQSHVEEQQMEKVVVQKRSKRSDSAMERLKGISVEDIYSTESA